MYVPAPILIQNVDENVKFPVGTVFVCLKKINMGIFPQLFRSVLKGILLFSENIFTAFQKMYGEIPQLFRRSTGKFPKIFQNTVLHMNIVYLQ
jgi:phenylalanine-4-hydroxylase